ncbi:hypothetical protein H4Q32_002146 [Labeo rohita]|uniref:Gypsy retrotransposon integrase-like protein 1 n=1 Tax=Labeo rohita TaxID=84645 RepID=A0ABQ8MMG9_LABRO|nr:hypothetical protein H4Q32_002146 [Labeo rohita]
MVTILKGLHGVQNYLDDLIVYGRTAAKHDRKRQAAQGLLPNDGHIQDIMQAPAPTDTAKLRSFLGLTSWYSRFVQNYPSEVEPMRACLRTQTASHAYHCPPVWILTLPLNPTWWPSSQLNPVLFNWWSSPKNALLALNNLAHQGHQGIVRTKQRLCDFYWWPGMDHSAQSAITSYQLCQAHDKSAKTHRPPLQPVPLPAAPWLKVGLDIVGPFKLGTWDCRYALTLVDYYSKWPEIAFTSNVTTDNVTDFLATTFSRFGNPVEIVTDNGVQFTSLTFAEFLTRRNIKHVRTSLYFPQANGAVEHMNHVLKDCVQTASLEGKPWKTLVRDFLLHYRTTPHATTVVAPSELLLGRQLRTNLNILPTRPSACTDATVQARVHARQSQVKTYIKRPAKPSALRPGYRVCVRIPTHVKKSRSKFSPPSTVVGQKSQDTYILDDGTVWNAAHLSLCPGQSHSDNEPTGVPKLVVTPETQRQPRTRRPPVWHKDFVT